MVWRFQVFRAWLRELPAKSSTCGAANNGPLCTSLSIEESSASFHYKTTHQQARHCSSRLCEDLRSTGNSWPVAVQNSTPEQRLYRVQRLRVSESVQVTPPGPKAGREQESDKEPCKFNESHAIARNLAG